jgi:hypothetical protein
MTYFLYESIERQDFRASVTEFSRLFPETIHPEARSIHRQPGAECWVFGCKFLSERLMLPISTALQNNTDRKSEYILSRCLPLHNRVITEDTATVKISISQV